MSMLNAEWANPEDTHGDVSRIAIVESEYPIMECATCGLPVPMEANGDIYCDNVCSDKAFEDALLDNAIEEALAEGKPKAGTYMRIYPALVSLPEPLNPFIDCSCC